MNPNESILSLVPGAVGVISKKLLSVQGSRRFMLKCSKRFIVLVLTFWVNCYTWCEEGGPNSFFCLWISRFPSTICWKLCSFPVRLSCYPCRNQLTTDVRVYFWAVNSIPSICTYILVLSLFGAPSAHPHPQTEGRPEVFAPGGWPWSPVPTAWVSQGLTCPGGSSTCQWPQRTWPVSVAPTAHSQKENTRNSQCDTQRCALRKQLFTRHFYLREEGIANFCLLP